jgi:glutamine cyclotransferase
MQYVEGMCSAPCFGPTLSRKLGRTNRNLLHLFLIFFLLSFPIASASGASHPVPIERYRVVHVYPHDSTAFTQGLVFVNGMLYESTGLRGQSSLRMVDLESGRVLQQHDLPEKYFGEGLTDWDSNLIQLTWQAHVGFVYDRFSFRAIRTFPYPWEGWGLTHNSKHLILSDGSSTLYLLDPSTFKEAGKIQVTAGGVPVLNLNELEYIRGEIYANVWETDRIARISPATGKVVAWIDLSGLRPASTIEDSDAVLNGIAYDSQRDRLFVTGKLWPKLYEIKLVPSGSSPE